MLKISNLHTYYGAIHALKGLDMEVGQGEIVSLIGSNGAGKSTLLNTIIGVTKSSKGTVVFEGKDITNAPPYKMTQIKISISPEGREVFPELTVEENLRLGAYIVKDREAIQQGYVSGGEQQMLAVGRALMSDPKLLLLDEPSLGLAPNFVAMIFEMIRQINRQGVTILLIEQNANMALQTSDRAYVIENGLVTMQGAAKDIAADPRIKKAYLGIG